MVGMKQNKRTNPYNQLYAILLKKYNSKVALSM